MKQKRLIAIVGVVLILLFALTACDNNVAREETYTISGEVTNFEGKAVEDAKLSIQDSDGNITVTTNSNGEWEASNISGTAEIELPAEGLPEKHKVKNTSKNIDFIKAKVPEVTISKSELETIIQDLTSPQRFGGRLAGIEGGNKTEDYVNDYFKNINNLQKHPDTGDNYKQQFDHWMYYPLGPSKLEITDSNGEPIKRFTPLDDFIPLTTLVHAELNGDPQPTSLHLYEGTIKDEFTGDIVLLPEDTSKTQTLNVGQKMVDLKHNTNYDFETLQTIIENAKKEDVAGVILESSSENLGKVVGIMPYGGKENLALENDNPIIFKANNTTFQSLEDIMNNNDRLVNMKINYDLKKNATSNNIIGYIEGETNENLLIGAHIDHIGFSYNKNGEKEYYVGALDNASGTAVMMGLAKYAAENLGKPEKNLIFIGFGAEEINLRGSIYYAYEYAPNTSNIDLNNTSIINMDMMGQPMDLYNAESIDVPMLEKLNRILSIGYNIKTSKINESYGSDNRSFEYMNDANINKNNIIALATPDSEEIIHTREDTPDKLNYEEIKTVTKGLLTYIYNEAY